MYNPPEALTAYIFWALVGWNLIWLTRPMPFTCPLMLPGKMTGPVLVHDPMVWHVTEGSPMRKQPAKSRMYFMKKVFDGKERRELMVLLLAAPDGRTFRRR